MPPVSIVTPDFNAMPRPTAAFDMPEPEVS
jgi:hypothetical protein